MAAAIKNAAWIDYHTRRMHFAGDYAPCLDLDSALGKNNAVKSTRNYYTISFDLALDLGPLAQHHSLLRNNVALDVAVDTKCSFDLKGTLQGNALIDKTRPLFTITIRRRAWPLPRHDNPQSNLSTLSACADKSTRCLVSVVETGH
jgi:hypothetical protein